MLRFFLFTVMTIGLLISGFCSFIQTESSLSPDAGDLSTQELIALSDSLLYILPRESLGYAEKAILSTQETGDIQLLGQALYHKGSANWLLGNLNLALTDLKQSIALANEVEDGTLIARNNHRIGTLYAAVDDNGTAISFYEKALKGYREKGMDIMALAILNNIGKAYLDLRKMDSARLYLETALKSFEDKNNLIKSIVLFNLGDVLYSNNEHNAALRTLKQCDELASINGDTRAVIRANQVMAEIALAKGDLTNADRLSEKAMALSQEFGGKEFKFYSNRTRANVLFAKGHYEKAFASQQNSLLYQDSMRNEGVKNRLDFFNAQKAEEELNMLKEKEALFQVKSTYQQQIIFMTSLLLVFAMVAAYLFYRTSQRKILANKLLVSQKFKIEKQSYELQSLSTFKTKVIAIMSHDLKSPLQGLLGIVDILRKKLAEPEELEHVLPSLQNSINMNNHKINDLLEWSGASIQGENLRTETFDVAEVVKKAIEDMEAETVKKSITVNYSENTTPVLGMGNQKILRSVVRNLISNATKFSEANKVISVAAMVESDHVTLRITDQGIGMTEKKISELFTIRESSTTGTSGEKGSGIGLVICKDLIEMIKGSISVTSEEGLGSEFTLRLQKGFPDTPGDNGDVAYLESTLETA